MLPFCHGAGGTAIVNWPPWAVTAPAPNPLWPDHQRLVHQQGKLPFPAALADELSALMVGKGRDELVFTDMRGGVLRNSNWRARVFEPAVSKCQKDNDTFPSITPHDLRHTAASLAVSAGANVKAVQRMLDTPRHR